MSDTAAAGSRWNDGADTTSTLARVTRDSTTRSPVNAPFVSVVIPAYNCADTLPRCLASVFAQSYPRDCFEVIVIDDGSTDETAATARASAESWGGRCVLASQVNAGPAAARNAGIRAASGQIVAFTDADCIVAPNWLESLVDVFADHPDVAGVGGPLRNEARGDTLIARYLIAAEFYRHRVRSGRVEYLLTANAAFRRAVLLDIGGFMERRRAWAEDADLSFRLTHAGHRLLLAPEGSVTHVGVLESAYVFASGLYRYGFGNAVLAKEWPAGRHTSWQLARHLGAVILAPWLALRLRRRGGWKNALAFCPVIVIEHLAYSAGLIGGSIAGLRSANQEKEHVK